MKITIHMKRLYLSLAMVCIAIMASAEAKYIFYFIGDGMGANQVLLTEMYLAELEGKIGRENLLMTTFPYSGQLATFSDSNGITDSSAAGTCLASGFKTTNGYLGVNSDKQPVTSIASKLKEAGYGVGITTSVSIDHATPAAFYAHVESRGSYYTIGTQLAHSGFDFFGGASFIEPIDKKNPNATNLYTLCENNGYTFAHGYLQGLQNVRNADKMILIQEYEGLDKGVSGTYKLPYAIDKSPQDLTLPQITDVAIRHLDRKYDKFFIMVEGGAIDWACHGNDAATAIKDVIEFDKAIEVAYDFYLKHPDETLIVITADHETGGCALGNYKYDLNLKILASQTISGSSLSDQLKALHNRYGKRLKWNMLKDFFADKLGFYTTILLNEEEDATLYAQYKKMIKNKGTNLKTLYEDRDSLCDTALKILNKKSMVGWTTYSHSASAVPVFAIGVGAEKFTGWHDNSEVAPLIMESASK